MVSDLYTYSTGFSIVNTINSRSDVKFKLFKADAAVVVLPEPTCPAINTNPELTRVIFLKRFGKFKSSHKGIFVSLTRIAIVIAFLSGDFASYVYIM